MLVSGVEEEPADGWAEKLGWLFGAMPGPASESDVDSDRCANSVVGWAVLILASRCLPSPANLLSGYFSVKIESWSLAQSSAPISWYDLARKYKASEATGLSG